MARTDVSDRALIALARAAGLSVDWIDATGRKQSVSIETLRGVLSALGLAANNAAAIEDSRQRLVIDKRAAPKAIVAAAGKPVRLPARSRHGKLTFEHGAAASVPFRRAGDGQATFLAPHAVGYHRLEADG